MSMFNNSEVNFSDDFEQPPPSSESTETSPYASEEYKHMLIDNDKEILDTTFITVTNKRKRFCTTINCKHVPGHNMNSKLDSIYSVLASQKGFLECKPYFDRKNQEAWITAVFDNQESAVKSTENELFDDNEFKLTLLKDRADDEVKQRTLVIRDLPLDVNWNLLKTILQNTFGEVESLRLRIAGPWYRADVTFKDADRINENKDLWSIQYKKDLCRIAPASFSKDDIDERNQYTAKLTNLPYGTTPIDLKDILQQVKAKTCFIPRTRSRYNRRRFAYVSFASEEDFQKALTNIRITYNDEELFWEAEDTKTCHKCGSPKHLIAECNEKELANNHKEYQKQFSNIYSKYKVPNYRNSTNKTSTRTNQQSRTPNNQSKIPQKNDNNNLQNMFEKLLTSFSKDIEEKFNNISKQISELNDRIKLIEIKTGLEKPKPKSQPNNNANKNKGFKFDMSYFPTQAALNKSMEEKESNNNNTITQDYKEDNNSNTKRPLSESENSSSDDTTTSQKKESNKLRQHSKPDRKHVKIYNVDDDKDSDRSNDSEIVNIKETQKMLEKEIFSVKEMFEKFTIQWYNTQQNNNGNGSTSTFPNQ